MLPGELAAESFQIRISCLVSDWAFAKRCFSLAWRLSSEQHVQHQEFMSAYPHSSRILHGCSKAWWGHSHKILLAKIILITLIWSFPITLQERSTWWNPNGAWRWLLLWRFSALCSCLWDSAPCLAWRPRWTEGRSSAKTHLHSYTTRMILCINITGLLFT